MMIRAFMIMLVLIIIFVGYSANCCAKDENEKAFLVNLDIHKKKMREKIQRNFASQNYSVLTLKKETVDSFFLPVFLPYELNSENIDLCRLMRYDYLNTSTLYVSSLAYGSDFKKKLFTMNGIDNAQCLIYGFQMSSYFHDSPGFPVMIHGVVRLSKTSCEVSIDWYEPFLSNRDLDFPVHPECLMYGWNHDRLFLWPQATNDAAISVDFSKQNPQFNNRPILYGLFDSMILKKAVLQNPATTIIDDNMSDVQVKTNSGIIMRSISLDRYGEEYKLTIHQNPLSARYTSPDIYAISSKSKGEIVGTEDFTPEIDLPYLNGGRDILVSFKACSKLDGKLFPTLLTIDANSSRTFSASFFNPQIISLKENASFGPRNARSQETGRIESLYEKVKAKNSWKERSYYSIDTLQKTTDSLTFRQRAKFNIFCAAYLKDWNIVEYSLTEYKKRLLAEECDFDQYIYNLEATTQMSFRFYDENSGLYMGLVHLADAYRQCEKNKLRRHVKRLIGQHNLGFALIALKSADPETAGDLDWIRNTQKQIDATFNEHASNKLPQLINIKDLEKMNAAIYKKLSNESTSRFTKGIARQIP